MVIFRQRNQNGGLHCSLIPTLVLKCTNKKKGNKLIGISTKSAARSIGTIKLQKIVFGRTHGWNKSRKETQYTVTAGINTIMLLMDYDSKFLFSIISIYQGLLRATNQESWSSVLKSLTKHIYEHISPLSQSIRTPFCYSWFRNQM